MSYAGPKLTDPVALKKQAKDLVRNWPAELLNNIDLTPDDTIIRTPLVDRWLWPATSPSASRGKVVLVGDAWHPMTPNLGQGACCALEDAVVLAKKLANSTNSGPRFIFLNLAWSSMHSFFCWMKVYQLSILIIRALIVPTIQSRVSRRTRGRRRRKREGEGLRG